MEPTTLVYGLIFWLVEAAIGYRTFVHWVLFEQKVIIYATIYAFRVQLYHVGLRRTVVFVMEIEQHTVYQMCVSLL